MQERSGETPPPSVKLTKNVYIFLIYVFSGPKYQYLSSQKERGNRNIPSGIILTPASGK